MCRLWCCPLSCHFGSEIGWALQEEQPNVSSWQSFTYILQQWQSYQAVWNYIHSMKIFYRTTDNYFLLCYWPYMKVLTIIANFPVVSYSVATANNVINLHCESPFARLVASLVCPSHFHYNAELVSRASLPESGLRDYTAESGRSRVALGNFNFYCRKPIHTCNLIILASVYALMRHHVIKQF